MNYEMLEAIMYIVVSAALSARYIFPMLVLKIIDMDIYAFKKAGFLGLLTTLILKVLVIANILQMINVTAIL